MGGVFSPTNFLVVPGVPGGQSAVGGTGASEDLIFKSTSNATKGFIKLGDIVGFAYDETNLSLALGGDFSPTETLELQAGESDDFQVNDNEIKFSRNSVAAGIRMVNPNGNNGLEVTSEIDLSLFASGDLIFGAGGAVRFTNLTGPSLVAIDASENITTDTSSFSPTFAGLAITGSTTLANLTITPASDDADLILTNDISVEKLRIQYDLSLDGINVITPVSLNLTSPDVITFDFLDFTYLDEQLRISDGTELAPAYSFISDPNKGMRVVSADTLGFSALGSDVLNLSGVASANAFLKVVSTDNSTIPGNPVIIIAEGDLANVALSISAKGTGELTLGNTVSINGQSLAITPSTNATAAYELNDDSGALKAEFFYEDDNDIVGLVALEDFTVSSSAALTLAAQTTLDLISTTGIMSFNTQMSVSSNGTRLIIDALSSGEALIEFGNSISSQELLVGYDDTLTANFVAAASTLNVQVAAGDLNLSASGDITLGNTVSINGDILSITPSLNGTATYRLNDNTGSLKAEFFYNDNTDVSALISLVPFTVSSSASLSVAAQDDLSISTSVGDIILETDVNAERMRIENGTGFVGINTTAPSTLFDINGSKTQDSLRLRSGNPATTTPFESNQIILSFNGQLNFTHAIKSRHNSTTQAGNAIDFFIWDQGADADVDIGTRHVMTLDGVGCVGIGKTAPIVELDVAGEMNITGDITLTPVTGDAEIIINNSSSVEQLRISHLSGSGFNKIDSSIELVIETDTDDLSLISDSGNVGLNSTGGDVTLRSINGDVTIRATNGDIAFNTNALVVTSGTDFVGIGTTLPAVRLDVVEGTADTAAIFALETTGTNGARAETFVGDRDPNGNVTGVGGDQYLRVDAAESATYESKELTTGTEWFQRNVYPAKDFETNTQEEYDALFSDGVIDLFTLGGTLSGYTDGENITLSGGDGSDAAATAVITGGTIQSITFTDRGSDYTFSNVLTITGDTSSTATAIITVDATENNARAITVGTTVFPNDQFSGLEKFLMFEGKDLTINGKNVSEAGITYSGTDVFVSGDGQLQCFDAVDLKSSSTGKFCDIDQTLKVTNLVFRDWAEMGTVRGSFLFREIDMVNCAEGWTIDNPFSIQFRGAASFGNEFNGTLVKFKNLNREGSNFSFSDYRSNVFSATATFLDVSLTSFRNNSVKIENINIPTGNLFKKSTVSNATINSVADAPLATGAITSKADNGSGGTKIFCTTTYFEDEESTITGTTSYNGKRFKFNVNTGVSFDIAVPFDSGDTGATGSVDTDRIELTLAAAHGIVAQDELKLINMQLYRDFVIALDFPSTNVMVVNGEFVDTDSGEIEIGVGLDQSDPRINATRNFGFPASKVLAFGVGNDNNTATSITSNTYVSVTLGTSFNIQNVTERFRLTNISRAKFKLTALEDFSGFMNAVVTALKTGSEESYKWTLSTEGAVPDFNDAPFIRMEVKTAAVTIPLEFAVDVKQGEEVEIMVGGIGTGDDLTITDLTLGIK